eukprot:COSAG01_NODE_38104_length_494_cov_0.913924_1_plen_123_part_10
MQTRRDASSAPWRVCIHDFNAGLCVSARAIHAPPLLSTPPEISACGCSCGSVSACRPAAAVAELPWPRSSPGESDVRCLSLSAPLCVSLCVPLCVPLCCWPSPVAIKTTRAIATAVGGSAVPQ